jgi:hypothetical protein
MMKTFAQMDEIPLNEIILGIVSFFTISLGGLTIGLIMGILASIVLKYCSHVRGEWNFVNSQIRLEQTTGHLHPKKV